MNTPREFTMIVQDLFCKNYRVTFVRKAKGQFPRITKIERETIVFVNIYADEINGRIVLQEKVKSFVWSLYRESCHGKLPRSFHDAARVAMAEIAGL